ncbi:hypothetical protein C2845_PM14G14640 [Panicum miliaceum]|uniref:Peptidase M48 domain-containing protein n=1 Tax=Panicum miliaceum TaxID=4540 RepID=A0A3L6PP69_PANMI|nr:hypothetical protein C2845_PM14G14640 [Panicum miliaceum]
MGFFKDLLSRHLLRRPAPSLQPPRRDSTSEALPCCWAAAAASADAPASYDGAEDEYEEEEEEWDRMLPPNHPQTIRVQRIAAHLIAAACDDTNYGPRRLSARIRRPFDGIHWTVGVVDAGGYVSGFSTATGDIVVSTGLLRCLRQDDAVAAVLGHEVGHVIARHGEKRARNWFLAGLLANFAGELLLLHDDAPPGDGAAARSEWRSLFMRPCYRSQEYEADRLGLLLLAAAGYDPRAGPPMYRKLGGETRRRTTWAPRILRARRELSACRRPRSWTRRWSCTEKQLCTARAPQLEVLGLG